MPSTPARSLRRPVGAPVGAPVGPPVGLSAGAAACPPRSVPSSWSSVRAAPLLVALLGACAGGSGDGAGGQGADCGALSGLDRDLCLGRQVKALPPTQVDAVAPLAQTISDAMVREEAVTTWIGQNSNKIPMDKGREVCGLLTGREHAHCLRTLTAPHLQPR